VIDDGPWWWCWRNVLPLHGKEKKLTAPAEAAIQGTREVGLAVLATSLSLIAVFLPVRLPWVAIVGRFMYFLRRHPWAFAIAVSLLVAFLADADAGPRAG